MIRHRQSVRPRQKIKQKIKQKGQAILEFALVMTVLVPLLVGTFVVGTSLIKTVQVSNVCRDAVVLLVRAATNAGSGLDLSQSQNQAILIRAAQGLRMNLNTTSYAPDPNGKGVIYLSKVIMVGPTECSTGMASGSAPWSASNCPNYGQYVFAYRVVIGNSGVGTSRIGNPPSTTGYMASDGTISAAHIASDTNNRATGMGAGGIVTLTSGNFALISEMFADVSDVSTIAPLIYSRSIS